ncbi:MAG: hypothetical protein LBF01_05245, partial [Bacteroidales bacterium]|nr:hypothetical protein [Bacteroidales bacterium]
MGGIAGVNASGYIYDCETGSGSYVRLYQIGANSRAAGGIVGYNQYGRVEYSYNFATIAYINPKDENKSIAPMLGK